MVSILRENQDMVMPLKMSNIFGVSDEERNLHGFMVKNNAGVPHSEFQIDE